MKEKSKFVVLFLHNCKDEVTLYNYDRIKKFNPDVDIYPVGFDWHDLIEDSHRVYRHDEFPNNKILNAALNWNNTKTESDLCIYDFFLHYQDYDSYFIIEWDTYCNCSIEEIYGEAINSHDMFCSQMFTNQFPRTISTVSLSLVTLRNGFLLVWYIAVAVAIGDG